MNNALKFVGISGSLRKASCNTGLLRAAQTALTAEATLEIVDLSDIPFYNTDIVAKPAAVERVLQQIASADALVLACPEYNYSIAPALKNIIDWASREPDNALLLGMPAAILGAGGGMGTSRAQYHLRQVLLAVGMHALSKPEVFANAFNGGFDSDGNLTDARITALVTEQMAALIAWTRRLQA